MLAQQVTQAALRLVHCMQINATITQSADCQSVEPTMFIFYVLLLLFAKLIIFKGFGGVVVRPLAFHL